MKPDAINCPSCGAGHEIKNPGLITFVCEYCGNAVYWDEEKIRNAGKQSILPEGFSRLYRGAVGTLFNKRFEVLGRIRYSFGKGFWDEWFLEFADGGIGWLSEDNHELSLENEVQDILPPAFNQLRPGFKIKAKNAIFVVEEVGLAECLGVEGDLPKRIVSGEKYQYADASSQDGRNTLGIEYDENPPTVFLGKWINYASMKLDDEGQDW